MYSSILTRTLRTLKSGDFVALLLKSALLALFAFTLLIVAAWVVLGHYTIVESSSGLEWLLDLFLGFGAIFLGWLLLPAVLPAVAAFFQETIANRIEQVDYPEFMPPAVQRSWYKELWDETKFAIIFICINILILPFIFFPPIYFLMNGYLIGREFFETAAARHIGKAEAVKLRRENRMPVMLAGLTIVGLSLVPIIQLFAPFIGVALMVHLFHRLPKKEQVLPPRRAGKLPEKYAHHG